VGEGILERIVEAVQARLAATPPAPGLRTRALEVAARRRAAGDARSLEAALRARRPAVIAECKRASPSAGTLAEPFDPPALARAYAAGGAAAISVVTEPDFFLGDPAWIAAVREAVELPVLRKDFIVARRQLEESVLLGADAVLLIQRILPGDRLAELLAAAAELGLEALVEVFADEDPAPSVAAGARIVGVNARDLATFRTDLEAVAGKATALPADRVRVAESGIRGPEDLARLAAAGYDAFLVGEHLVRSRDPVAAVRELVSASG